MREPVRLEILPNQELAMTATFSEVADPEILRKMKLGLPTVIVLTAALYRSGRGQPLASVVQSCRVTWHVWEEMYWVEVTRAQDRAEAWSPTEAGVLRRCTRAERLSFGPLAAFPRGETLVVRGQAVVNPLSADLLEKLRLWVSRPMSSSLSSGGTLFGTLTGLFMARIGEAERVVPFAATTRLPP